MDRFGHEKVPLIDFAPKKNMDGTATSCVTDSQGSALDALKAYDHNLLVNLITDENASFDVNKGYPEENFKTLLHLAVDREDLEATNLLLKAGADPNIINRVFKTSPLHVAARKGNLQILDALLKNRSIDVNAVTDDGKTSLHLLVKKCDAKNHEKFFPCIQLILKAKGIQVDKADRAGQSTPLYLAAKETRNFEVVKILARHGAPLYGSFANGLRIYDVLVSSFGLEVAKSLLDDTANFEQHMLADQGGGSVERDNLLRLLDEADLLKDDPEKLKKNLKDFEETIGLLPTASDLTSAAAGEKNIVQVACDRGLSSHLRAILSYSGVDPNVYGKSTSPPLLLAAKAGHSDVIRVLREHKDRNGSDQTIATTDFAILDPSDGSTVLQAILRKPVSDDMTFLPEDKGKYERSLEAILSDDPSSSVRKEIRRIINRKDTLGNTALHYATMMWPQSVVRLLLESGANIGVKNIYDEVPIAQILPETMEKFLNEHCMTSEGNVTNENFKIKFKFDFLVPPYDQDLFNKDSETFGNTTKVSNWTEKDAESLSREKSGAAPEFDDTIPLPETEGLWYMSQSKKHQHLLKHPVIAAFLFMKWQRMGPAYNKNLLFYFTFVACLTGYIFCLFSGRAIREDGILTETCERNESNPDAKLPDLVDLADDVTVLWYTLTFLLAVLAFRETLQCGVAPRRYFFSFENLLEVTMIALTATLLFYGPVQCHISAKRQISAIIIVLSWSEFITMIGRHPRLSVYNIYVTMFYKVSSTFILFLAWYSCYIIAFGLGFYILLHKDDGSEPPAEGGEEEYPYFDHIGLSLVKTFTMFVGELEFGDLPIETTVGYLFLLAFIFLIVVVMMNLLNGLAVSDTGVIRQEAEIHSYKSQVGIVSYMESMMLGDPFNFLSNWPKYIWLKHVPTCSLVGGGRLYHVPPIRALFHTLTGARYVMLFHKGGLNDTYIEFYPNQDKFGCRHLLPVCRCCRKDPNDTDLPESIVESAKNLIIEQTKSEQEDQVVLKLESRLERVESLLLQLLKQKSYEK